jgi:hypothetical protein
MQTTQYIGLSPRASKFLRDNEAEVVCAYPGTTGVFDEPIDLTMYKITSFNNTLGKGYISSYEYIDKVYFEVVQCTKWWEDTLTIFTCLVDTSTGQKLFEWGYDEINFHEVV